MHKLAEIINEEILKGLPGTEVQWQMASSDRMINNFYGIPGPDTKVAAVLILLFPVSGSLHTVFMQRPDYKGVHGGQISFPGGKKESDDSDIIQTALRETFEETGVDPEEISVLNTLTPLFIPVSNTMVTPVIGWMNKKPVFSHHPREVVFLFEAEIKRFLDPSITKTKSMNIHGTETSIKYFDYNGNIIWGATAMILNELLTILKSGEIKTDMNL